MTYQEQKQRDAEALYKEAHEICEREEYSWNTEGVKTLDSGERKVYKFDLKNDHQPHIRYYIEWGRWGLAWDLYADDYTFGTSVDFKTDYSIGEFIQIYLNGLKEKFNATHLEIH